MVGFRQFSLAVLAAVAFTPVAQADIVGEDVVYQIGDTAYEGYFARNTGLEGDQPVVLIIHDWDGLDDYEKRRAEMLAERGYAAFAADLYGQGVRPESAEESRAQSGALSNDREEMRARLQAAIDQLGKFEGVDPSSVVAMGYCFGGGAVLELARSGADMSGFASFHGSLGTPEGQDYENVNGSLLVLHGSADESVPMSDVATLANELDTAGVDFSMEIYGGAPHAFTVWSGDRYRAGADLASWQAFESFLDERLR